MHVYVIIFYLQYVTYVVRTRPTSSVLFVTTNNCVVTVILSGIAILRGRITIDRNWGSHLGLCQL